MKIGYRSAARATAIGLAIVIYVLLSHYVLSQTAAGGSRFAAIALLPYLAVAAILAWRSRHRYAWLLMCGVLAMVALRYLYAIGDHAAWVYFVQHVSGDAMLALVFGATLVRGRVPLCTRIASFQHQTMEPRLARYTRQVTLAWTLFFAANVGISVALFAYAPIVVWSTFANILAVPLVALMFAVEYLVRLRCLPNMKHTSIFDAMRGYIRLARTSLPPAA